MEKIFPTKLQRGDLVRVISPSRSMSIISEESQKIANSRLEKLGLKISFSKNIGESDEFSSSSIESRISDLHAAFQDPSVRCVLTTIGGYNANQLLKYIDWEIIKKNPKIFCGFSDITVLNNAIFAKTGLVTYSGPHYSTLGKMLTEEYTIDYLKKCLFSSEPFEILPSTRWDDRKWWLNQEDRSYFPNPGWQVINEGQATGTILGANLCTFNLLRGTEYWPDLDGSILFLEDDEMPREYTAVEFDRNLQSLIHQPGFDGVKGILIGRFQKVSEMTDEKIQAIIRSKKELNHIPVIAGLDFGHTDPKITFPIGGTAEIDIKKSESIIKIVKH